MSKHEHVLESLKLYIRKVSVQDRDLDDDIQLPLETALRIQTLIQTQVRALKSAETLIDALKNNYDKNNSWILIDEDIIKINEIIIKSALK